MPGPRTAVTVTRTFVDREVSGFAGHVTSSATLPASNADKNARLPWISRGVPCCHQRRQRGGQFPGPAHGKGTLRRVAFIGDRTPHGQPLPDCGRNTIASPEPVNCCPDVWPGRPLQYQLDVVLIFAFNAATRRNVIAITVDIGVQLSAAQSPAQADGRSGFGVIRCLPAC